MNEDVKMFHIGLSALVVVFVVAVGLQVCYRTQSDELSRIRNDIVQTQQKIAAAQTEFASFVRPEILRNSVSMVCDRVEVVGFNKSIEIQNLPDKMAM